MCLIYSLNRQGKIVTKTFLDKLLFVLNKETLLSQATKFYNFYPHHYGPFSNNFYKDLTDLESLALVDENFRLSGGAAMVLQVIPEKQRQLVEEVASRFSSEKTIVQYVYENYSDYTTKSKLKNHEKVKPVPGFYSIGYEGNDVDSFLDSLIQRQVEVLVDVRANPFSMNFAFTQKKLRQSLENAQITYEHFPQLGIEGVYRKQLNTESDYKRLFEFYEKQLLPKQAETLQELIQLGKQKRVALMCFEHEESKCHRGVLSKLIEQQTGERVEHL